MEGEATVKEEWRPAVGHPGYEVSDQGRVRNATTGRVHRMKPDRRGYQMAWFGSERESLHRAVLRAFVGEPSPGAEGSHLNGNPSDNRAANLQWEDHLTNMRRKHEHRTIVRGERVNTAKLTPAQVREIRTLREHGLSGPEIARRYGINYRTVYQIVNGETWRSVK